jgi:Zn-finger nucleic acid-binding protein
MPLPCPRCRIHGHRDATLRSVVVPEPTDDLVLDTCDRCRGLWLDLPELRALAKPLAEAVAQREGRTRDGHGIERCPACRGETEEFLYGGLWLDRCLQCDGVWLDGHEHDGLASIVARRAQPRAATYREAPEPAPHVDRSRCVACGMLVPGRDTLVTEDGTVCLPCSREALKKKLFDAELGG